MPLWVNAYFCQDKEILKMNLENYIDHFYVPCVSRRIVPCGQFYC